ncbi:hypothetical protein HanPSC8_Chr17g0778571 [Helianthus annuus]|nr:hypothetical protein HanPSC8_Chr17g0778571 [Helianthus annuus]
MQGYQNHWRARDSPIPSQITPTPNPKLTQPPRRTTSLAPPHHLLSTAGPPGRLKVKAAKALADLPNLFSDLPGGTQVEEPKSLFVGGDHRVMAWLIQGCVLNLRMCNRAYSANLLSLWEVASGTFILWKLLKGEHCPLPLFSWRLEVVIGPNNGTATSHDNFLRVNLVGDFVGYNSIPSFEDFFLVIPRQGGRKIWEGTFLCGCYLNE